MTHNDFIYKYGHLFGVFSVAVFLFFVSIAFLQYPNYNIFTQTLSSLGAKQPSAIFFNIGIICTSVLFIPFYYSIHQRFQHDNRKLSLIRLSTCLLSAIALFFVAIFPEIPELLLIHKIASFSFFLLSGISIVIVSYEIIEYKVLDPISGWIGAICICAELFFAIMSIQGIQPFLQKVTIATYILWALSTAWYLSKSDVILNEST